MIRANRSKYSILGLAGCGDSRMSLSYHLFTGQGDRALRAVPKTITQGSAVRTPASAGTHSLRSAIQRFHNSTVPGTFPPHTFPPHDELFAFAEVYAGEPGQQVGKTPAQRA